MCIAISQYEFAKATNGNLILVNPKYLSHITMFGIKANATGRK
jgi:hypothetical protein